jgi:hypothetical protein
VNRERVKRKGKDEEGVETKFVPGRSRGSEEKT